MADWVAILDTQLDPDAPITSGLGYQLRDNPLAAIEGASGAPKVRLKTQSGSGGTVTFDGFAEWDGFTANIHGNADGAGLVVGVSFSDDGSTFYGAETVLVAGANETGHTYISCDFASQNLVGSYVNPVSFTAIDEALTGGAFAVTHVRFTASGNGCAVTIHANGGQTTV